MGCLPPEKPSSGIKFDLSLLIHLRDWATRMGTLGLHTCFTRGEVDLASYKKRQAYVSQINSTCKGGDVRHTCTRRPSRSLQIVKASLTARIGVMVLKCLLQ